MAYGKTKCCKKKLPSGSFYACLQIVCFQYINGSNQTKRITFAIYSLTVGLHDLSRSYRLNKHVSAESKLQLPKPSPPLTAKSSYLFSAALEKSLCMPNKVEDKLLDEIF